MRSHASRGPPKLTRSASYPRSSSRFLTIIHSARSIANATSAASRPMKAVRDMKMVHVREARITPSCWHEKYCVSGRIGGIEDRRLTRPQMRAMSASAPAMGWRIWTLVKFSRTPVPKLTLERARYQRRSLLQVSFLPIHVQHDC